MNRHERRALRELARDLRLPPAVIDTALECGALAASDPFECHWQALRQMRRLMTDLGVNAPGAALLVRMRRDLERLQAEVARLQRMEDALFGDWRDAAWRDLE